MPENLPNGPIETEEIQNRSPKIRWLLFWIGTFLSVFIVLIFLLNFFGVYRISSLIPSLKILPTSYQPQEEIITTNPLLTKVDSLISLAQNPDKQIIDQYGLLTGTIDANTQELLDGLKTSVPGVLPKRGLNDLKTELEAGNNKEVKIITKEIIDRSLLGKSFRGNDDNDLVNLTEQEIQQLDPNNNFPWLRKKGRSGKVSLIRKTLLMELTRFFNSLK